MNTNLKTKVIEAIKQQRLYFPSDAKHAIALDIHPTQYNLVKNGNADNIISDGKWASLARRLDVQLKDEPEWKTAKTEVFKFIYTQLTFCQNGSLSGLLCDISDIGKTYAACQYVRKHKNAVHIDCAQVKSKQKLIRAIAKEFGVPHTGRYSDVYEDLVFYIKSIETPLIVLDEAGDLDYPAFLELKALWNATERACGWYMMGAEGLEAKITRNKDLKKVGYTEIFSRFGNRYQSIVPFGKEARVDFLQLQVNQIARANGATNIQQLYAKTGFSLRRVYTEVQKLKVA